MSFLFSAEFDTFDQAELAARIIRRRVPDIRYISITTQRYRSPADQPDNPGGLPAMGITQTALVYGAGDMGGIQPRNELVYREEVKLSIIFATEYAAKTASHIARGNLGRRIKILAE